MHEQLQQGQLARIGRGANRDLHQRGFLHGRFIVREAIEAHLAVVGADARLRETAEAHVVVRQVNDHIVDGRTAERNAMQQVLLEIGIVAEDVACQRVTELLCYGNRLIDLAPSDERQYRAEDLLLHHRIVERNAGHDRGLDLQSLRIATAANSNARGFAVVVDQVAHAVEMMLADHVRVFGIAQDVVSEVLLERFVQLPNKLVSNALVHEQVVGSHAGLPGIQTFAPRDALSCDGDIGEAVDETWAHAAQLERDIGKILRAHAHDLASDVLRTREEHLVHVHLEQPVVHMRSVNAGDVAGRE